MGGGKGKSKNKNKSKPKTKAQKMAAKNIKKYGGTASAAKANKASMKAKAKSYTKTSGAATAAANNKAAMKAKTKAKYTASQAAKKAAPSKGASISKGTTGIGPVSSGKTYSKAVSNATNAPTKKTTGIGPYADGAKYAAAIKATPKFKEPTKVAGLFGKTQPKKVTYPGQERRDLFKQVDDFNKMSPLSGGPGGVFKVSALGNVSGLGIGDAKATGFTPTMPGLAKSLGVDAKTGLDSEGKGSRYLSTKSPTTFGAPSQEAVDKAAGITAGGLNIGGGGFTPKNLNDPTARAADTYDASLNPNSFKGLSDGETFGVGPVASGDAYARGLNIDNKNVENIKRSFVKKYLPFIDAIPGVNTRPLTDKEIADKRVKAQQMKKEMMDGRKGGGGGARLAVAATTPEEILLEEEEETGPIYQQSGLDNNNLMQIQQNAYNQELARIYNPLEIGGFNPEFRFFNRQDMGGGAFRKAFRIRD